jgi:hypothetical protein
MIKIENATNPTYQKFTAEKGKVSAQTPRQTEPAIVRIIFK